ncbi:MAG: UbiA family prenyltransferase [Abitibacteriaceae bacterium]|nr:UbiA family prenyltransferase [Abditibacteriaceae bacterium]
MRAYLTLLRLPYQFQLGPIFGWGYLLAGGRLTNWGEALHFVPIFLIFHIGAFGGLTALNSYYDQDSGPVGGLWEPPVPPPRLYLFSWCVQLSGLLLLLILNWHLMAVYGTILLLSLGYSHPRPRWKGHAWKSLITVAVGQGVLDFLAGALTVPHLTWNYLLWWGMAGATLTVAGFYPLTQLYQVADDTERGDQTLALVLMQRRGRAAVFMWSMILLGLGITSNALALWLLRYAADALLLLAAGVISLGSVWRWSRSNTTTPESDFQRVHRQMLLTSLAFSGYVLARLVSGGL